MRVMSLLKTSDGYRWQTLWPLAVFAALLLCGGYVLYGYWPELLFKSAQWQKQLHQTMAQLLQQVENDPARAGGLLIAFSFIYGVLHSAGPGHGKIVISTYLATHPTRLRTSLMLTLLSSLAQGVVAILLVAVSLGVLSLSSRQLQYSNVWLEKASYVLVIVLGLILCYRAIKRLRIAMSEQRASAKRQSFKLQSLKLQSVIQVYSLTPVRPTSPLLIQPPLTTKSTQHIHSADCGCGHRHLPTDRELDAGNDWRTRLAIIFAIGIRPCSGAILVLLFSKVLGVFVWGMAAAMAMAIGTALTVCSLALLVSGARRFAERLVSRGHSSGGLNVAISCLALLGGLILILSGFLLYQSVGPLVTGGIRPFG